MRLLTFCNPLLDITATVDPEFLEKHGLEPNNAIMSDPVKHSALLDDLQRYYGSALTYSAGGAGQNAARAAQFVMASGDAGAMPMAAFVGCVGEDRNGELLAQVATNDGLHLAYMKTAEHPTGTCVCLLTRGGQDRSLVACLGAANAYNLSHLSSVHGLLETAEIFYITGFFMTVSPETIQYVAKYAMQHGKKLALNLSAPFLSSLCLDTWLQLMPFVDILFGNETEAVAYATAASIAQSEDIGAIAKEFAALPMHPGKTALRIVVITQGSNPTILSTTNQNGRIDCKEFPVTPIPSEEIIDTTGAGDAFVGGFLGRMAKDGALEDCIQEGHQLASQIIRTLGVSFRRKAF